MSTNLQKLWASVETNINNDPRTGYVPVPDGKHTAVINEVGLSQNEGYSKQLYFKLYFPAFGKEETSYDSIPETGEESWAEGATSALVRKFQALKLKVTDFPDDLERVAKQAEGWTLEVFKKTKTKPGGTKSYQNYYFNKVVDRTAVPADTKGKNIKVDDESIPF